MRARPGRCRQCGRGDWEVGRISWGGLCIKCGVENMTAHNRAISDKRGPAYNLWLKRCAQERARRVELEKALLAQDSDTAA